MVGRLLARLNLPQRNPGVGRRLVQHLDEQALGHKVGAGAGSEISPARQQAHRPQVYLLVATRRALHRLAGLGEGRRVEDDEVKLPVPPHHLRLGEGGQQVKYIFRKVLHPVLQPVAAGILPRHLDGALGNIHAQHIRRAASGCV